jgi:hypothetical protein
MRDTEVSTSFNDITYEVKGPVTCNTMNPQRC